MGGGVESKNIIQDNDENIAKALPVGVNPVAKTGCLPNNVKVYPMFDSCFSDKFGFTWEEVAILLYHHKWDDMKGVKLWYGH